MLPEGTLACGHLRDGLHWELIADPESRVAEGIDVRINCPEYSLGKELDCAQLPEIIERVCQEARGLFFENFSRKGPHSILSPSCELPFSIILHSKRCREKQTEGFHLHLMTQLRQDELPFCCQSSGSLLTSRMSKCGLRWSLTQGSGECLPGSRHLCVHLDSHDQPLNWNVIGRLFSIAVTEAENRFPGEEYHVHFRLRTDCSIEGMYILVGSGLNDLLLRREVQPA